MNKRHIVRADGGIYYISSDYLKEKVSKNVFLIVIDAGISQKAIPKKNLSVLVHVKRRLRFQVALVVVI